MLPERAALRPGLRRLGLLIVALAATPALGAEGLPFKLPRGTPSRLVDTCEDRLGWTRERLDVKLTEAEDVCMVALVCWGEVVAELEQLQAAAEMASRGDLNPARAAANGRRELGPALEELKRRIDQHCGDHGNGQGGPRVIKALNRLEAKRRRGWERSLARAQQTDPMGLSPPHVDGAETPPAAAGASGVALATETLKAIAAALAEWGPVLAPAAL